MIGIICIGACCYFIESNTQKNIQTVNSLSQNQLFITHYKENKYLDNKSTKNDQIDINDFKKIKTIKTEFSNNPTISYINQDNQEKQYEFYIMSQKGDIKVTIVILKNNIIKILDDENHQVHYYQSQNINYEKLNIDHLPW